MFPSRLRVFWTSFHMNQLLKDSVVFCEFLKNKERKPEQLNEFDQVVLSGKLTAELVTDSNSHDRSQHPHTADTDSNSSSQQSPQNLTCSGSPLHKLYTPAFHLTI